MDLLKITPPFFYSYQCGSTLLTSYIPVHMYSISLQLLFTFVSMIIILMLSNKTHLPSWMLALLPGVCWPSHLQSVDFDIEKKPIHMIEPHQIISRAMNNIILLLSFGLCSPVLGCYIAVNICLHLYSWLVFIGRFVFIRTSNLPTSSPNGGLLHFSPPSSPLR
jgi:hypothetical protein